METKDFVIVSTSVFNSLVYASTLIWAVTQYKRQRKHSFDDGMQANRSRLTEAYMSWHAAILSSQENIKLASSLIRRGHHVLGHGRNHVTVDQTHAVHILYMMLNALFLEWNYRRSYKLPIEELDRTIDHGIIGIINNTNPEFKEIVDNFDRVFEDFPSDFRWKIQERIKELRDRAARAP
jgi:hypothetical protein